MDSKEFKERFGVELNPRIMIKPKAAPLDCSTPEGKAEALRVIRSVIKEHHEVLEALSKR